MNKYTLVSLLNTLLAVCITTTLMAQAAANKQMEDHRVKWIIPVGADTIKNPYANNVAVTDTGKKYYNIYCSVCHGDKGKGNGIAAAGLSVRPADHTSPSVQAEPDGWLYMELTNGRAPMPAFKSALTDKQRWALVNYIRQLGKPKK